MFILARRIAGALLVFGFLYFFIHGMWDPRPVLPTPPASSWGMFPFMAWLLTFGMIGTALLCGKSAPGWFNGVSLLAGIATIMFLFNWSVPPFLAHIHHERDFWLAYIFNIVPAVQFLSWIIMGRHNEPDMPTATAAAQMATI